MSAIRDSILTKYGEIVPVYPESLGIGDTNLKDKNGKVIFASFVYEDGNEPDRGKFSRGGDIVKSGFKSEIFIVEDEDLIREVFIHEFHISPGYSDSLKLSTILGNAYQNPELAKCEL